MKRFTELQSEWNIFCESHPEVCGELEQKVVPLLLQKDIAYVHQGMELLLSFGEMALCFLLRQNGSEIKLVDFYPGVSQWKMKDLRHIQKVFRLPKSKTKAQLVQAINKRTLIRYRIIKCVIEEVCQPSSEWFGLFDSGCFANLHLKTMAITKWDSLEASLQQRILKTVKQMVEIPQKKYCIGKYQVTQVLWESVLGKNPSYFKGSTRPVDTVSWMDCVLFCNKLSEQEGREKVYHLPDGLEQALNSYRPQSNYDESVELLSKEVSQNLRADGYRLPTEWEWRYAAKANQEFIYAGSDDFADVAWSYENSPSHTQSVGQKKANGFGLFDMSGNINEWCWDWDGEGDHTEGSTGPSTGTKRMLLGGCWLHWGGIDLRVCSRGRNIPSIRAYQQGFRLCRTLP